MKLVMKETRLCFLCLLLPVTSLLSAPLRVDVEVAPHPENAAPFAKRRVAYKTTEQGTLHMDVYAPRDVKGPRPGIVFFFGGGWTGGSPKQFYPHCEYLASRGMVAISAEYRIKNKHGTSPFECVEDGKSAIRYVREHAKELGIDPRKVAAGGGSAGGHVAACTGVIPKLDRPDENLKISSVPDAMVLFNPVLDTTFRGYGAKRFKGRETEISPAHHIRKGLPPTIIFHGQADTTVPIENAERYTKLATEAGNVCKLVSYKGKKHGFFNYGRRGNEFRSTVIAADKFLATLKFVTGEPTVDAFLAEKAASSEKPGKRTTKTSMRAAEENTSERTAPPPNLLIIQTDEHHYGTLGCYGGSIVKTPHIDRLAREGAKCTSFYATTPVCSPSRAAFVSGRYPQNTPVVTNNIPLADDIVTFAEMLKRRGYATGYAGKWHLDGTGKPQWAPKRKFGFDDNRFMFNRGHWKKMEDTAAGPRIAPRNAQGRPTYAVAEADAKSFTTDWLADKAVQFIQANRAKPFCYFVSLPDPHGPNSVRAPYDTMFADVDIPIPATLKKPAAEIPAWGKPERNMSAARIRKLMPAYYGMVKCIDDNVGKLLDALEKENLLDRTIVVFTADHGDLCGEHGRLNKGVPYEGSAKIPFVLRYPRSVKAGTKIRHALSCVDFLPTILTMMGVPAAKGVEGRDASGLFTGSADPDVWEDVAFLRSTGKAAWICAVGDNLKIVYSKSDRPWLFDLKKDPDERINRFDDPDYRGVARHLTLHLRAYGKRRRDPYLEDPKIRADMEAVIEKLKRTASSQ